MPTPNLSNGPIVTSLIASPLSVHFSKTHCTSFSGFLSVAEGAEQAGYHRQDRSRKSVTVELLLEDLLATVCVAAWRVCKRFFPVERGTRAMRQISLRLSAKERLWMAG